MIDHDDIQAEENRRREVAVKAGASPRATKYEPSPYKDLIKDYVEETKPAVEDKFKELLKNDPKPGFNMVAVPNTFRTAEEIIEHNKEVVKQAESEDNQQVELLKEAAENEPRITKTSTGQPKVDASGNIVEPLQGKDETNPLAKVNEAGTVKAEPSNANPSPLGSGDARSISGVVDSKASGPEANTKK